jgi:adenylate kinase family enzyme
MLMKYNRILITGDAGRGKSTLASKLSLKLGIPHHSTDDFFYEIKFSKTRDRQEALSQISEKFKEDKWIVEGTTAWLLEPGMQSANVVIYLHYTNIISQWWALLRRGIFRKNERLRDTLALMRHVFYKRYGLGYKKGKMTHREFIEPYKDKTIALSSFEEIDDFVESAMSLNY